MRYERMKALVFDTVASSIGTYGLVNELFLTKEFRLPVALFCLVIVLFPGALGVISLRMQGGGSDTTQSGSQSPPPSGAQPAQPSSSGA